MHTGQQRVERPVPAHPSPAIAPANDKDREAEFEATLGSLVEYYSTLPPGALEASVQPAQEARVTQEVRPLRETQRIALHRHPLWRATSWVVGGTLAMALGGVATFAIMVGPSEFFRMIQGKVQPGVADQTAGTPTIPVTEKEPTPAFEVKVEPIRARVPSTGIVVEPLDAEDSSAEGEEGALDEEEATERRLLRKTDVRPRGEPRRVKARRGKRRASRAARRATRAAAAAVAAEPAAAAERVAPEPAAAAPEPTEAPSKASEPAWEDPYQ
jgi:hypothetical protein